MGTNFYLIENEQPPRHIGKSSMGWCFSLRVYPDDGINNLLDWESLFQKPGTRIEDEYGATISATEMSDRIRNRSGSPRIEVPSMYRNWTDFYERNHAVMGPNNLLRHRIGDHCIGHGEGTWDYIIGEFC